MYVYFLYKHNREENEYMYTLTTHTMYMYTVYDHPHTKLCIVSTFIVLCKRTTYWVNLVFVPLPLCISNFPCLMQ